MKNIIIKMLILGVVFSANNGFAQDPENDIQDICNQCKTESSKPDNYMQINIASPNSKKQNIVTVEIINGIAYQGDIELGEINGIMLKGATKGSRWENSTIPYTIEGDEFTDTQIGNINRAASEISTNTNLCVVPRTDESDYVHFRIADGKCSSALGRTGGIQIIKLGEGCANTEGKIIHEILHAAGLIHEHNRADRDTYVTINDENILEGKKSQFKIDSTATKRTIDYDYGSIMHYGANHFSKNGKPTIETIPSGKVIGQRSALSSGDIETINSIYPKKCSDYYSCTDNMQNQGEEKTDCGGPCQPCHCKDGEKSGDEESRDCGGSCYLPCDLPRGPQPFDCESACESKLLINCNVMTVEDANGALTISNIQIINNENTVINNVEVSYILLGESGEEINLKPYIMGSTIVEEVPTTGQTVRTPLIHVPNEIRGLYELSVSLPVSGNTCLSSPFGIRYTPTQPSSPSASCFDRIQNQGETETDCGGPYCEPCLSNDCKDPDIAISGGINRNIESPNHITAPALNGIATIQANAKTIFDAGRYIDLLPGFTAEYNSRFDAFIDGCGGLFVPKISKPNNRLTLRNYPNPFTNETTIEFELPSEKLVNLFVADMMGKKVATLLNNEQQSQGIQTITFNGKDHPPGMYYYTIQVGDDVETQKMVLMR